MDPQKSISKKRIQLIVFKNENVEFFKKCKIIVDKTEDKITVIPKKNGANNIVKKFDENFGQQNKYLYSWTASLTGEVPSFVLIFPSEETSKKIFDHVFKSHNNFSSKLSNENLQEKFIIPFFKAFLKNKLIENVLHSLVLTFLQSFTIEEKQHCKNELKNVGIAKKIIQKYFNDNTLVSKNLTNLRKRKWKNDIETDNNNSDNDVEESEDDAEHPNNEKPKRSSRKCRKIQYSMSNIVESPNFKVVHVTKNNRSLPKLIIFPLPQDRTKCYEYFWSNSRKAYVCCGCSLIQQKYIQALIFKTNNGKECVRFQEGAKHVCQIREYNPEKNDSDPSKLIIESPNFKIFSYLKKGVQKKTLVIFNANKTFCYEYFWSSVKKRFECSSCSKKGKLNAAWIFEKDGKECIRITPNGKTHLCTARKFDAKRFSGNEVIIYSPNYQIVTDERKGVRKEKLLIFPNENDREHCYEYYWKENCKSFLCAFCSNRRKYLSAKIVQIDGSECAVLNSLEHVCKIQNYDSNRYKFVEPEVIDESGFVLRKFENESMSKSILFIFDPTNKNLGYEYYWHYSQLCYYCVGCREYDKATTATVYQNPDGKEYVKPSKSGHICDLQEFDAEKMTKRNILQKADFKLLEKFRIKKIQKLLFIFSTKGHKFGYQFKCTEKPQNRYMCVKCNSKKYHVSAYLYKDKNGDDYISVQEKEHLCTPVEYIPDSYEKQRKIVEAPNFQIIQRRIKNKFLDKLIIFDSSDKSLCFEYTKKHNNQYICNSCYYPHKHHVFAKIIKTSNGTDECVELGPNEHKCKLIKFESPESLIVQLPNFKIQTTKRYGEQRKTLLIFSSENPKLKYEYHYCTERHEFLCGKCKPKKRISAKLLQNKNGEDYLVLNSTKHLCKPF